MTTNDRKIVNAMHRVTIARNLRRNNFHRIKLIQLEDEKLSPKQKSDEKKE